MRKNILLSLVAMAFMTVGFAQTGNEKPASVLESMYLLPKRGMDDKLEAAIKAHDLKFHPDGPYVASLQKVEYGDKAGWYVWNFGPTLYASIDSRPTKEGGHDIDWNNNVDPLVDQYGPPALWQYNEDLSCGMDIAKKSSHFEIWGVFLKHGNYYRFKELAGKLKKTYESMGSYSMLVFDNPVHTPSSPDVAIVWNFSNYAEWAKDMSTMSAYEKLYGPGSWQNMIKEWNDLITDYNSELRSVVK